MKINCPSCGTSFEGMATPFSSISCPACKAHFAPPSQRRSPYRPEVEQQAAELVAKLRAVASGHDEGVRQCALMHLENEWLGKSGHRATIKLGPNISSNAAKCSICGKDTRSKGFMLHIVSRWRNTTTAIYLCEEHKATTQLHETDVDLHQENICPPIGLA